MWGTRGWIWLVALALLSACETARQGGALLPPLEIHQVHPDILLPGSRIIIEGEGFAAPEVVALRVDLEIEHGPELEHGAGGERVQLSLEPERVSDTRLMLKVEGHLEQALIRPRGTITGQLKVVRLPKIDAPVDEAAWELGWQSREYLAPSLKGMQASAFFVGDTLVFEGQNFLYDTEGLSVVEFDGAMQTEVPVRVTRIQGLQIPGQLHLESGGRQRLSLLLTPDIFGIIPGTFTGRVRVVNQQEGWAQEASEWLELEAQLKRPELLEVSPKQVSRGQWLHLEGRGFAPADGMLQSATLFRFEGRFTPKSGAVKYWEGPDALMLLPDVQEDHQQASVILRIAQDRAGTLSGLGLEAGRFSGEITPMGYFASDVVRGQGLSVELDILPQLQVVHLRALPGFQDALSDFGLLAEEEAVKARILEVVRRDYEGVHIAFSWQPPEGFAEYSVVEIGGYDPNGTGLLGLDNTEGKDVGNLRFNDVIGGYNAETSAGGYAAYGGVFPAEFIHFSYRLRPDYPMASTRFDDVFEGVMPALGGQEARAGESAAQDARGEAIREAIRVYGNLVGSTISHEVGHSLGLAAIDGQFHNIGDNPGWLMDAGSYRPFEERAELDGQGPSFFGPVNRAYLEEILPLP